MQHKIGFTTFENEALYETAAKAIIMGYSINGPIGEGVTTNAIVFSTTAGSAQARVANYMKGNVTPEILCIGLDTTEEEIITLFNKIVFSGHIIFTPELGYIKDILYHRFAQVIEKVGNNIDHRRSLPRREAHILFPDEHISQYAMGAMFEEWKSYKERIRPYAFYGETRRFGRLINDRELQARFRKENLWEDGELDDDGDDISLTISRISSSSRGGIQAAMESLKKAAPTVLDAMKTFRAYKTPYTHFDRQAMHPVRLGVDFHMFSLDTFTSILNELCPHVREENRTVLIHDSLAWAWFQQSITHKPQRIYDGNEFGTADSGSDSDVEPEYTVITMDEIAVTK